MKAILGRLFSNRGREMRTTSDPEFLLLLKPGQQEGVFLRRRMQRVRYRYTAGFRGITEPGSPLVQQDLIPATEAVLNLLKLSLNMKYSIDL
ncbi:hypothetical protein AVEN_107945-1 [Araneus ventricosus]|uniref:Uncharacterized protein n=1 Tax=Araneus ventricosus TaxID=182803 RepID=A0A4Y2H054_ARAVE|nr:hypothetical protein AVEN_107945-1 [Araneus ventricosus]